MKKNEKFLISILLILFFLVLYLILTSESTKQINNSNQQVKQKNSVLLEDDYKSKAKEIFVAYDNLIKNSSFNKENIIELRSKLLGLKVPKKFKDLHYKFVSALDKMEDYLIKNDEQTKSASLQIINQLKADYSWLNG